MTTTATTFAQRMQAIEAMRAAGVTIREGRTTAAVLVDLGQAYRQAQAEEDKGFMTQDSQLEFIGHGKVAGLRTATAVLLDVDEAVAVAALDGLTVE